MKLKMFIFMLLWVIFISLNTLCAFCFAHTGLIHNQRLIPYIGYAFCVSGLIISILILIYSIKLKNSSILFVSIYWWFGAYLFHYAVYIRAFKNKQFLLFINDTFYASLEYIYYVKNPSKLISFLLHDFLYLQLITLGMAFISTIFLIRYYIKKDKT